MSFTNAIQEVLIARRARKTAMLATPDENREFIIMVSEQTVEDLISQIEATTNLYNLYVTDASKKHLLGYLRNQMKEIAKALEQMV
jgi:hypothetical protein